MELGTPSNMPARYHMSFWFPTERLKFRIVWITSNRQ